MEERTSCFANASSGLFVNYTCNTEDPIERLHYIFRMSSNVPFDLLITACFQGGSWVRPENVSVTDNRSTVCHIHMVYITWKMESDD